MIAWILTLWANPLARKIITYAAVIAAICYGLRLWGNKQWSKGEQQGRNHMAVEMEKAEQAEWKAIEAGIAADANTITSEKRAIKAATDQLAKDRLSIASDLKNALAAQAAQRNRDVTTTANIPDSELDPALRAISSELAAH